MHFNARSPQAKGDGSTANDPFVIYRRRMMQTRSYNVFSEGQIKGVRLALGLAMAVSASYFVVVSWQWAMLCDSPIMHYVTFLMQHGMKPYSEITDNNLPGSYLTESAAMAVFGGGDVAWRVYEFFLLTVVTCAMVAIAQPYDWLAGVYAGGAFLLVHGGEGPWLSAEREQVMTALLMVGYAFLFVAVRRRTPWLMVVMGFAAAMAAAIKPTVAPLALILLVVASVVLRRREIRPWRYVVWGAVGMALATALNVAFLLKHHAWADFLFTQRFITPYYVRLTPMPFGEMVRRVLPPTISFVGSAGLLLAVVNRGWNWERWALALGAGVGLASYFQQRKGFLHHRYMFLTFVLLLVGLEVLLALRRKDWTRWVGAALIVGTVLVIVPRSLVSIRRQVPVSGLTVAMEEDLERLGGTEGLQRQVQCLDLVYGCLNALYHLRLVENTGFTGDMLIFDLTDGPQVRYHRAMWMQKAKQDPSNVLVMTNEYFQGDNTFAKVNHWPEYAQYLAANYVEVVERTFPYEHGATPQTGFGGPNAYRIYLRRESTLLAEAPERLGLATKR